MKPAIYSTCSFKDTPCRFCSEESTYCACTFIQKKDGHYIGVKVGYIKSERGQYCNNACAWIKDLKSCPKDDDTIKGEELKAWEKEHMKKTVVKKKSDKKTVGVEKTKPVKKVVKKTVKKPSKKLAKKIIKKLVKKVTPPKKKKVAVKKSVVKKPAVKKPIEKPSVKKPLVKKKPVVKKKKKKISVVKKAIPKRKKEIIYI